MPHRGVPVLYPACPVISTNVRLLLTGKAASRGFKRARRGSITPAMEFQHSCSFCGWGRSSATPVMLAPSCERCGCALDATAVVHSDEPPAPAFALPPVAMLALRWLGALTGALVLYAAAKLGYGLAGPSGALIAFGAGGFLLLPFVPERLN
jgi:hypothetical protein